MTTSCKLVVQLHVGNMVAGAGDARRPVKTKIVVTMNARSLLNFFELRCCLHAQWEIRAVANEMLSEIVEVAPTIFEKAGPPCKSRGTCPEGDPDCPLYPGDILNREE